MATTRISDITMEYIASVDEAERLLRDSLGLLNHEGELSPDDLIEILERARACANSAASNLYDAIRAVGVAKRHGHR